MADPFHPPPLHSGRPGLVAPVRVDPQGAAGHWLGAPWFDGSTPDDSRQLPVVLASAAVDIREQDGIRLTRERLNPRDILTVDGVRVTNAARSVFFEMRYAATLRDAVVLLDMAAFSDLISIDEVAAYAEMHPGWTGVPQARRALLLGEENTWSPAEARMRMIWQLDAGLPRPLCNRPIFDLHGRHIGTPDLFDPVSGTLGEYDGALHLTGQARSRDVARESAFRDFALECFTVLGPDVRDRAGTAARMIQARRRARWLPEDERPWTLTPPPWWQESHTVALRRQLTGRARQRVLEFRARLAS